MADEPVFKEINEQNDSFRAAKAEIEAEVFSSKIEQIYQIKPDLNLFSSITPTKKQSIYENLIAKNSTSLPVNRITTSSVKFSFNESNAKNQEGETKEITQIVSQIQDKNTEVILNYSNNISMEEFNDTNVRKLEQSIDRETNLKESKKAELDAELYNAKLNFKANLSFFNSVTPSRLENDSEEKMLQIKNSRSLPFKRFEKSSDSMLQIIENKTEVNTNTNDINIKNESKLEESVVSIQSDVSIEIIEDNAKDSEHEINEEIHANEIYDVVTEKSKLESQKVEKEVIHEADEKSEDSNKENGEIKKDHYKVMIEDTDSDSELPDLVVKNSNTVVNESINEDQNECTANKTTINEHLNDVTLKYYRPVEDDVSSSEASDIDEVASSQQSAIVISQKKTDLNRSIDSKSSIIIECTIDQNTQESTADQSVSKDNNSSNTSFDLNMSSISANNSPSKLALHMKPLISTNELLSLPTGEEHSKSMSRNSSASSLFSHISSVSQQYEQSQEKYEEKLKKSVRKRIQPSTRNKEPQRHMDDNELSIKKATEEAIESRQEKVMIKRRKSDLSSTSSSSNSTANIEAVAKLRANLQQIPSSFGSNETEVRVTRSKLRALIEPTDNVIEIEKPTKATVTRTRSARTTKKLEDLNEEASNTSPKMSISNLKKHNAAFEKMDEILNQQNSVENDNESVNTKKTARSRNTRKATRSPSPTASSCVSESTIASTNATATKANTKTTRGKAKTAKQEATIEENCSPTSSVVSIASTSSRYSMRERKIETSIEPTTSGSSATASATKTVKTKAKTTKLESSETALAAAPEVAKVKRTRSNLKKAELEKITEAEVIALIEDSEDGFSTSQDTIASQGPKKSSLTRSASVNDDLAKRSKYEKCLLFSNFNRYLTIILFHSSQNYKKQQINTFFIEFKYFKSIIKLCLKYPIR